MSVPSFWAPHSHPLRVSPCSQQQSSPWVCSPNPMFQHPPSRPHKQTPISGWGTQGCGTDHLCRSHSAPHTTDHVLYSPLGPQSSPSVSTYLLSSEGASLGEKPLHSFSSPSGLQVPSHFLFSFFPFLFCPSQLHRDLACTFRCPMSSASLQQVLCEDCPICRCILDAFVLRGECHVLLLHHLDSSPIFFSYM